jgi:hypothetical protein
VVDPNSVMVMRKIMRTPKNKKILRVIEWREGGGNWEYRLLKMARTGEIGGRWKDMAGNASFHRGIGTNDRWKRSAKAKEGHKQLAASFTDKRQELHAAEQQEPPQRRRIFCPILTMNANRA